MVKWVGNTSSKAIPIISTVISVVIGLREEVKRYLAKKKVKDQVVHAVGDEARAYIEIFEKLSELGRKQMLPLIQSIKVMPTTQQMNRFMDVASEVPLLYAQLLNAFIKLAKACNEVSKNKGFMESLKDSDRFLFDFVSRMADTYVGDNKVEINGSYYRFFKIYQYEIFQFKEDEMQGAVAEVSDSIKKVKQWVDRAPRVRKKVCKKYIRNLEKLSELSANITIEDSDIINLRDYIPSKLLPFVILLEEIS